MPLQSPYLVSGLVYSSKGKVSNSVVVINSDLRTTTNSEGQYVVDLANLNNGYTADASYSIQSWDEFDNEYVSSTITVTGQNQTKNLFLSPRTKVQDKTNNNGAQRVTLRLVGDNPVTNDNPLPVLDQERMYTEKLAYTGDLPEYHGYASPGTPTSEPRWRIRKLIYSGNNVVGILYANGSTKFDSVWDDRAGYDYS